MDSFEILTWLLAGKLLGSPDSFPHEHLTVWPLTSVLCTATMACAADSLVENLIRSKRNKGNCYKTICLGLGYVSVLKSLSSAFSISIRFSIPSFRLLSPFFKRSLWMSSRSNGHYPFTELDDVIWKDVKKYVICPRLLTTAQLHC